MTSSTSRSVSVTRSEEFFLVVKVELLVVGEAEVIICPTRMARA